MNCIRNHVQLFLRIAKMFVQYKWQKYLFICALLLAVACRPSTTLDPQIPSSNNSIDVESTYTMLIQLEDLNWLPGDQREIEDPGSLSPNIPYEAVYTTLISPIPKPHSGHSARPPKIAVVPASSFGFIRIKKQPNRHSRKFRQQLSP